MKLRELYNYEISFNIHIKDQPAHFPQILTSLHLKQYF
jgi:hypothetical protein